jgi:hypothetical protein
MTMIATSYHIGEVLEGYRPRHVPGRQLPSLSVISIIGVRAPADQRSPDRIGRVGEVGRFGTFGRVGTFGSCGIVYHMIREWIAARRRRRVIAGIRRQMAFFGYPLDDMTDEEIEEGAVRIGRAVSEGVGVTADEVAQNFARFGRYLIEHGIRPEDLMIPTRHP